MIATHSMHHPKAGIHRLYLPRSNWGKDLTQLELSYKTIVRSFTIHELIRWLAATTSFKASSHSIVKEARKFAREIDLDLETEFNGEMKNMENAWKLKRIAKEKRKKAIDTGWKWKPLHGQYPVQSQKADIDLQDTHQWLRSTRLNAKSEGFIVIAQDQSLFTRNFQANILHNGANSVIQVPRLLTTLSQGALFLPQMSIQPDTIILKNIYTAKSANIMIWPWTVACCQYPKSDHSLGLFH